MIYLTSDFHFGHEKNFIWEPRGFGSWIEAAHKIIQNYNSVIDYDDTVYILGDCMLHDNKFGLTCLRQLKGHKYLAYGNHDTNDRIEIYKDAKIFEDIGYDSYPKFNEPRTDIIQNIVFGNLTPLFLYIYTKTRGKVPFSVPIYTAQLPECGNTSILWG